MQQIVGEALGNNQRILKLASRLGFDIRFSPEAGTTFMRLDLRADQHAGMAAIP
jgi:hypothetical protein